MKELIAMLKHHEGVRYVPYRCPANLWTIGVGHVIDPSHISVPLGQRLSLPIPAGWDRRISDEEVESLLSNDLRKFVDGVARVCGNYLTDNRLMALTSFAFNLGVGNLQNSTLRQKHNRGDFEGAADEFLKWNKAGGKVLGGLVIRRKDERALYLR